MEDSHAMAITILFTKVRTIKETYTTDTPTRYQFLFVYLFVCLVDSKKNREELSLVTLQGFVKKSSIQRKREKKENSWIFTTLH